MRLFVYGTLMKGEKNHRVIEEVQAEYVGTATVPYSYLLDLGAFPGLIFQHATDLVEGQGVYGELYDVTPQALERLDIFEGVPTLYDRVEANTGGGKVWLYEWQGDITYPVIESGNWKDR